MAASWMTAYYFEQVKKISYFAGFEQVKKSKIAASWTAATCQW